MQFGIRTNFFTFVTLFLTLCPYFLYVGAAPVRDSGGVTANMLMKRKNTLFVVDHATMYELQKRLKELRRFLRLLQVQQTPSDDVALSFLLQDYRQEKNGYHGKDLTLLKSNPIQKRYKRLLEEVTKALKGEFPDLTTFMKKFAARQSTENRERLTAAIQNVAPNVAWQEQVQRFIRPIMMDSFITYTGDRVKVEEQPPAGVSRVSQTRPLHEATRIVMPISQIFPREADRNIQLVPIVSLQQVTHNPLDHVMQEEVMSMLRFLLLHRHPVRIILMLTVLPHLFNMVRHPRLSTSK
ncbi:hypothetical protein C8Q75DRAFT_139320 [Abortiporus biennis]|nr:hypothetical protein C8Q75DRAFT_139320 [Abortiporus biennis]